MTDNKNLRHEDGSLLSDIELGKTDAINLSLQNGMITVQQAAYLERLDDILFKKELNFILQCNDPD